MGLNLYIYSRFFLGGSQIGHWIEGSKTSKAAEFLYSIDIHTRFVQSYTLLKGMINSSSMDMYNSYVYCTCSCFFAVWVYELIFLKTDLYTCNLKRPCFHSCFSWMTPNRCMNNSCFTMFFLKDAFQLGVLEQP